MIKSMYFYQSKSNETKLKKFEKIKIFEIALVLAMFSMFAISCKKNKGVQSFEWQNESLKLTSEICLKFKTCADSEWKSLPDRIQKFAGERLDESNCQKRFRDSNVYRLIGGDTLTIQNLYRDCHKSILRMSCSDLQNNQIESVNSCSEIKKIQGKK
ncbi:hypothetical protein P3G55_14740 [Leptospira sp. 96542]|nr:hypothetical protein [Leptospira sp. 96542]